MWFMVEFYMPDGSKTFRKYFAKTMRECDELAEIDTLNEPALIGCEEYNIYVAVESAHDMM